MLLQANPTDLTPLLPWIGVGVTLFVVFVAIATIAVLFLIFWVTRYRKFKTNEYVIHFRNGRVRRAGTGGRVFLLPVLDEIVVIPTTVQQTLLEAKEQVVSTEYQDVSLTAYVFWRVTEPEVAFGKVNWQPNAPDYVERVIKNATESIIRTTCANMPLEEIIRQRHVIIKRVTDDLHALMSDWGITVESVEVRDVQVLDRVLKENLEATKKLEEEQRAKLRRAEMEERTQLRNLDVAKKTGTGDQDVKLAVETKAKERQIQIQQLEQNRVLIEADTARRQVEIQAEAERVRRVKTEIDIQVERMEREAKARKTQLLAQAEGEAAVVREKLLAEAEGFLKQVQSIAQADERYIQLRTLEILPEVFKNIKVDRMLLLGEGQDAYKSITQLVLPFVQIAKEISDAGGLGLLSGARSAEKSPPRKKDD